jgi:hypothetical protein
MSDEKKKTAINMSNFTKQIGYFTVPVPTVGVSAS